MADAVVRIPDGPQHEMTEIERTPLRDLPEISKTATPSPAPTSQMKRTPTDMAMSSATNLIKLLPTTTVLAFQTLSPSFSNRGSCNTSNAYLTGSLIVICALSCVVLSFTDSIIGRDNKLYYGIATWKGFYVFNYNGPAEERNSTFKDLSRLRMRPVDFVHAFFTDLVFLAVAFSNSEVQSCFFSGAGTNTKQLLINLPLGAGVLSTTMFMIFPTSRKGIGYSDSATQSV